MIFLSILMTVLVLLWLVDGLRLRQRLKELPTLPMALENHGSSRVLITAEGLQLPPAVERAAQAYAEQEGLDALVLVGDGLNAADAFLMVQTHDPRTFRKNRIAPGKIPGAALLLKPELLDRMERRPSAPRSQEEFARLSADVKKFATTDMDLVLVPGLKNPLTPATAAMDPALFSILYGAIGGAVMIVQLIILALGLIITPKFAVPALLLFLAQPLLVMSGKEFAVKRLLLYAILRPFWDLKSVLICMLGAKSDDQKWADLVSSQRVVYANLLASGTARFFEAARTDCPICGSHALAHMVTTADRFQFKPGSFTIDRCESCDHKFQNPRLSIEGLEFYYKDFYDGLGERQLEGIFGHKGDAYLARARMLRGAAEPKRWLDVGGGHGHFCSLARDEWPSASFDVLDLSSSVLEAEKKGWADRSYRGLFPDIADSLDQTYDVISMSHYLEHTRDPAAEIDAASRILPEGGHLLIELPDPDCRFGKLFGSFWLPWFQPQHQHFLSVSNLEKLLREKNFEPLVWHRGEAHQPIDILFTVGLMITQIARPLDMPWLKPSTALTRIWNRSVFALSIPVLIVSRALDYSLAPFFRRPGWSNAYRVLARRVPG